MGKFKITPGTANIHCRVKIGNNPEADGTILRQKSSKRFLVTDGKSKGICTVSNLEENKLTSNTMNLSIKKDDGSLQLIEYLSNKFALGFDKKRFIITGASTTIHENATLLTDEEKAKISKTKTKKKPVAKKKTTKKPVAKKKTTKKPVAKKKTTKTSKNNAADLFDFSITED